MRTIQQLQLESMLIFIHIIYTVICITIQILLHVGQKCICMKFSIYILLTYSWRPFGHGIKYLVSQTYPHLLLCLQLTFYLEVTESQCFMWSRLIKCARTYSQSLFASSATEIGWYQWKCNGSCKVVKQPILFMASWIAIQRLEKKYLLWIHGPVVCKINNACPHANVTENCLRNKIFYNHGLHTNIKFNDVGFANN